MNESLKRGIGNFLKGFLVTLFLMTLIMFSGVAESRGTAGMTINEVSSAPLVARAGMSCTWESVSSTTCSRSYCYANKVTADQVCIDKGYNQAMSYTYNDVEQGSAYRWTGSWTNTTADNSDDVGPKGGGGLATTGGKGDTSTLSSVLCC